MSREAHVRFDGSGEGQFLPATLLYRTALYPVLHRINNYLLRWIMKKYKKLRTWKKAIQSMSNAAASQPRYFAHWAWAKPANR